MISASTSWSQPIWQLFYWQWLTHSRRENRQRTLTTASISHGNTNGYPIGSDQNVSSTATVAKYQYLLIRFIWFNVWQFWFKLVAACLDRISFPFFFSLTKQCNLLAQLCLLTVDKHTRRRLINFFGDGSQRLIAFWKNKFIRLTSTFFVLHFLLR